MQRIAQPAYDEQTIAQDFEYVAKKLDLTVSELQEIMDGENKTYRDYKIQHDFDQLWNENIANIRNTKSNNQMIAIIDYGLGNVKSICQCL